MSKHLKKRNKLIIPVIAASMLFGALPAMAAEQAGSPKLAMAASNSHTLSEIDSSYIAAAEQFLTTVFGLKEVKFDQDPFRPADNQWILSFEYPGGTANDSETFMMQRANTITINEDGSIEHAQMELAPDGARPAAFELAENTLKKFDNEGKTKLKTVYFFKKYNDFDDYLQFNTAFNESEPTGVVAINSSSHTVYGANFSTPYQVTDAEQKHLSEAERVLKEILGKDHVEITRATHTRSLVKEKVKETWSYLYENGAITFEANTGKIDGIITFDSNDDSANAAPDLGSKEQAIAIANPYMTKYFDIDLTGYEAKYKTLLSGPGQIGFYDYIFSKEGQPDVIVLFSSQGGIKSIFLK
ncbi:hypothetical protein QJ48_14800 [Paenibacillus sp. A3]|uniref:hypothetical protein n=1 Tax=Paenibacillus sp. A3 TaxID=1337054 RepID=UPI0006D5B23D|nr:hypothetical protein [Paenibacillus sp. A3]KPV58783.1 hypothetical protein QJ48_14800 [Paenibacillus sp. A3]